MNNSTFRYHLEKFQNATKNAKTEHKVEDEEEIKWEQQFINACMKHPTKNEDGEIEDITVSDGIIHFITIGW